MRDRVWATRVLAFVVPMLCIAGGGQAVTCTVDQRPAATLLIPYFQATFNSDGSILSTGPNALDTLVTVGNASPNPMLASVIVFSERSEAVMSFNIALTGFDVQSFSMASVLQGNLPVTPVNISHVPGVSDSHQVRFSGDVCQRNPEAAVFPSPGGFLRVRPSQPATGLDNTMATVAYPPGPFAKAVLARVLDSLDSTKDSDICGGVDSVIANPIHGYITIDHVNYCTVTTPNDAAYYTNDAIGMENNLFGDYIYTSGAGIGTMGFAAVAIEADASLADFTAAPVSPASSTPGRRTFYRRNVFVADPPGCLNAFPAPQASYSCGGGDQREPLGLKYAVRWFDTPGVTSSFTVWRASAASGLVSGGLGDLLGFPPTKCNTAEPQLSFVFFDEDENSVISGICPQPCVAPTVNIPLESQRIPGGAFPHPSWPAGWALLDFLNASGPVGGALDQAWVTYGLQGSAAFLSAGILAIPLDRSTCQPLGVPIAPLAGGVTPSSFVAPLVGGVGPSIP